MHIVFVSHYALPHLGGIEVVIDELARRMAGRGHQVTWIAASTMGRHRAPLPDAPYRVVRIPAWNIAERIGGIPYPIFAPWRLRAALRRELDQADVVHAHGFLYSSSARALARARPGARVLTEHVGEVPYDNRLVQLVERIAIATRGRRSASAADAIIVLNDRVADLMRRLAPAAPVTLIPNGVDLERFRPALPHERQTLRDALGWDERPRVLFVGRLVEKKGVRLAIAATQHAWSTRNAEPFELVLAGRGEAGHWPHVQSLGEVPGDRIPDLYRAADAFLLPSRGEGFPLTAQEAMASGLPVVLGADPAYTSTLQGSGIAVQQAVLDPPALAEAVARALRAGEAARLESRNFARARFSWDTTVDRHLAIYAAASAVE